MCSELAERLARKKPQPIWILKLIFSPFFRGKFGVVYKCECLETKKPFALKVMLKKGNKKEDVMREVSILQKIDHPGILHMTEFMEFEKEYVLVTEL